MSCSWNKKFDGISVLKLGISLILVFQFFLPSLAQTRSDTISFIHISDIHFCNLDGYHPIFVKKRQHYGDIANSLSGFFKSMPGKLQSDFIVITGDMTDYYEAELNTESMLATNIEQFVNLTDDCNVPIYMTLGNHDIASYWIDNNLGKKSNQLNAVKARAQWIKNTACFRNGTYYSRTFQVDSTTYRLIFLDNGYYSPDRKESKKTKGAAPNIVDKYQLLWLDSQLKQSDDDVEIIFTHIPLFTPDLKDLKSSRNTYFLDMNDTIAKAKHYEPKEQTDDVLSLWNVLKKNASTNVVFSGHLHSSANYIVQFTEDYSLHQIMTGSFGRDIRNWRLIQLTDSKIIISYPGVDSVQYTIELSAEK